MANNDFGFVEVPAINYFVITGNIDNLVRKINGTVTEWYKGEHCVAKMNYSSKGSSFWLHNSIAGNSLC